MAYKSNYRSASPYTDQDIFSSWFYEQRHWRFRVAGVSRTYKSKYGPANPTTDQDIYSSWFFEQGYWRLGAARVFKQRRTRLSSQYVRGCFILSRRFYAWT